MLCLSYKEDHTDSCKGCTMDPYPSRFEIKQVNSIEEAVEHFAQLTTSLEEYDIGFDHYLLPIDSISEICFDEKYPDIGKLVHQRVLAIEEQRKQAVENKRLTEEKITQEETKRKELATLKRLQEKYGVLISS